MIIATRNRLIHGYLGIDDDTLWRIIRDDLIRDDLIRDDLPELLPLLKSLANTWRS